MVMENGIAAGALAMGGAAQAQGKEINGMVINAAANATNSANAVSEENKESAAALNEATSAYEAETGDERAMSQDTHFPHGISHDAFVLQYVQPGLVGLIDGTVSSLAPIFAAAMSSSPRTAFLVGMATALGAGVSMGWSEALSDTGKTTGRGSAIVRGVITGGMTTIGGVFHTLPFLIPSLRLSLLIALIVVAIELFVIAWIRYHFLHVPMKNSLLVVTLGGAIVLAIGMLLGVS
ncbi:VIT1/CCC1 transporter family protein [Bifidobacterium subtile]|jgi:hypothetical protein|uniref:Rubrerythrin n=1 Tax=Bifidobacterium subtile TaxID=77635 RepID=A0A087E9U7_9BIFI|nr:hypothetical protein [Bifidobacterium subtile]KFJ04548.1 rubrerythrin [Bifidobacterium subtile]QOL35659.1 hypothetical protein BS3272_06805 [Bifidobacterium subtile]